MKFDIDVTIVVGFLVATIVVGLGHGKGIKNIKDYALGGRNFSTGALVATIVATWISGSTFFIGLSRTYSDGLYYVLASSGMALSFLITAFLFVPRMGEFLGNTSIAESMGNLYGRKVRIITAITGSIAAIGFIAVQFKVFGSIFNYFLGFSNNEAIIISAVIVTAYSAFGGIKAVTFTDMLQLFTFGFAIPIVGVMIWNHAYYEGFSFSHALDNPKFNLSEVLNIANPKFLQIIPLILYFSLPGMEPEFCQRIIMGRNISQVKKAFIISSGLLIFVLLTIQWIPFLLFNINSNLNSNHLISYVIDNYTYTGLKGLLIAGVIAMAMSSADSNINASSVLFSNDICKPLNIGKNKELFISKLFALLLGIGGTILAISTKDLLDAVLTAESFYMPVVTIPLMLSILGFRSSTKSVLIGMSAGSVAVIIWNLLAIEADCIVFAMLVNLMFLIGSHYLLKQPGGWVGIKDKASLKAMREEKLKEQEERAERVDNFNFIDFCKKYFPGNELSYTGLGIYLIIYTITTMYSTQVELLKDNSRMILVIYQIMLVSGVVLLMYPIWPRSINQSKRETIAKILWPVVIFYMLALFNSFFVIVSNFSTLQFAVFTVNLLITSILLGWRLGGMMIVTGVCFGISLYQAYNPEYRLDTSIGSPAFIMVYIFMLVGAIIAIFLKPKQEYLEKTEAKVVYLEKEVDYARRELENVVQGLDFLENRFKDKEGKLKAKEIYLKDQLKLRNIEIAKLKDLKDEFIRNLSHESNTPLTGILSLSEVLYSCYDSLDEKVVKQSIKDIVNSSDRLKSYVSNIADLSKLSALTYDLKKEEVDLSEIVRERPVLYKKIFTDDAKQEFVFKVEDKLTVQCDEYYITQAIDNLISNAVKYGKGKPITISLEKTVNNKVKFTIEDEGIGIPKDELISIFHKFTTSSRTRTPAGGRGVGLALCEKIIKVHNGEIQAESNGEKGARFSFVLPL